MTPRPNARRNATRLLLALVIALVALLGALFGAWRTIEGALGEVQYTAHITHARPSPECADLANGMEGVLKQLSKLAGKLPFKITLPTGLPNPLPAPDEDPDDGRYAGDTCRVDVDVEVVVHNPLPIEAQLQLLEVRGSIAGEEVTPEQLTFDPGSLPLPPREDTPVPLQLHIEVAHLVAAGGGLLLRNSLTLEASATLRVQILGGLFTRNLKLQAQRKLTLQQLVQGIDGVIAAEPAESTTPRQNH